MFDSLKRPDQFKMVALGLLIAYAIIAGITLLGWDLPGIFGVLLGALGVGIAKLILSDATQRRQFVESVSDYAANNPWRSVQFFIFGSGCILLGLSLSAPEGELAKIAFHQIEMVGFLAVFLYSSMRIAKNNRGLETNSLELSAFLFAYMVVLSGFGHYGEPIFSWAQSNPDDLMAVALSFSLCVFILKLGSYLAPSVDEDPELTALQGSAVMVAKSARSPDNNRYHAAHEVGHVMPYAALDRIDSDVKVMLHESATAEGVLGYVTGVQPRTQPPEATFAQWQLLVLLAGCYGEYLRNGETTIGNSDDHQKWLSLAHVYLSCDPEIIYYPRPNNDMERDSNEQKLQALRQSQLALLKRFFAMNRTIFDEMVEALETKFTLEHDDLAPFFERTDLPEEFPQPQTAPSSSRNVKSRDKTSSGYP